MIKKNIEIFLAIILFFFIAYSYISKLYYQLDSIDEVNYLADSLLLIEGITPSSKHSPSGISTWIGLIYVGLNIIKEFAVSNISNINDIFNSIDYVIYKNYKDLTNIKLTLILLNLSLIIILFIYDKQKTFTYIFLLIFTTFFLITISFSGKPFFCASVLAAISLILKDKKKLSSIFFGLALAEKWEFIVLVNYICYDHVNKKFNINNFFIVVLVFLAVAPWFSISLFQNIKIQLNFILTNADTYQLYFRKMFIFFLLVTYILSLIFLTFIKNIKFKYLLIFTLFIIVIFLVYSSGYYLRWFLPFFLIFAFEFSKLNICKIKYFNLMIIFAIFLNLIYFNKQKFISDLDLLDIEKSIGDNKEFVLSEGLLKEDLSFKNYLNIQLPYLLINNIKNKNYFKNENAPIAFSVSGNLELLYIRRYEFLAKYEDVVKKNKKFIIYSTGLQSNTKYWCNKLDPDKIKIVYKNKTTYCYEAN